MDAGVHHLQGKAERVKPAELLALLVEFSTARERLLARHVAAARVVSQYEHNNAYQYVIAREDTHFTWLRDAIAELGGEAPGPQPPAPPAPAGNVSSADILREDADSARAFVEEWTPRVESVTNERHRLMLGVILGETLEHSRLFAQGASGRIDLLGRRHDGSPATGRVLAERWVE